MKIICLECHREIGEKFPFDDPRSTHTICPQCIEKGLQQEKRIKMARTKSRNYIVDMKTGFYNRRFFNVRLREERRRTERSGSPFSLLTLNISDLAHMIEKRPKLKIHQIKKIVTNIVRGNTRDIDIKSWHGDTILKILMPETPESGANLLAEKLQEKVKNGLRTFFGLEGIFDFRKNMMIKSYPLRTENSDKFSESEPSVSRKSATRPPIRWTNKKIKGQRQLRRDPHFSST